MLGVLWQFCLLLFFFLVFYLQISTSVGSFLARASLLPYRYIWNTNSKNTKPKENKQKSEYSSFLFLAFNNYNCNIYIYICITYMLYAQHAQNDFFCFLCYATVCAWLEAVHMIALSLHINCSTFGHDFPCTYGFSCAIP